LIVDDNPAVRMVLSYWLQRLSVEVVEATDGLLALQAANQMEFDFAIIDVGLPRLDGIELCRKLFAEKLSLQPLKVWLMTGVRTAEVQAAGLAAGAIAVLPKPFDVPRLLEQIAAAVPSMASGIV
jgi:CheY-like chemotaxis protein